MVVALGPGRFYGSSLPRPRIYTDVKFNDSRVDPPVPVLHPFMSWAEEAHWSMGGLSFTRHRLQGRVEGNIEKLRAEKEKSFKKRKQTAADDEDRIGGDSPSPPPAPIVAKRRRFMALIEEEEEEEEEEVKSVGVMVSRRSARKLGDDFDRVAVEGGFGKSKGSPAKSRGGDGSNTVASRTRSRRSKKEETTDDVVLEVIKPKSNGKKLKKRSGENGGIRTSPRLLKRGLN